LDEPNWNSACVDPHIFTEEQRSRLQVITVPNWESPDPSLADHLVDANAVICCVGNRQPGWSQPELKKGWVSYPANRFVVQALRQANKKIGEKKIARRVVVMSSVGVAEGKRMGDLLKGSASLGILRTKSFSTLPVSPLDADWPPMEFFTPAKLILGAMFVLPGICRKAYHDLSQTEALYRSLDMNVDETNSTSGDKTDAVATDDSIAIDYLIVRPVGLGEDVEPVGDWKLQVKKYEDVVGGNMGKD
jgi:hypothetical protein